MPVPQCAQCAKPIDVFNDSYLETMDYSGRVHRACWALHLARPETWKTYVCPNCKISISVPKEVTSEILLDPLYSHTLDDSDHPSGSSLYAYIVLKHLAEHFEAADEVIFPDEE